MERKGILIAIEGIDGAGKSTQARQLGAALRNASFNVVESREPTDGPWGRKLRESALSGRMSPDEELHAFIEDRKQHVREVILPALQRGDVVVLDRYFYSTIAYQGARGLDVADLDRQMREIAPTPDVTFLIDVEPSAGVRRVAVDRGDEPNEFEQVEYLSQVRDIFKSLAESDPAVHQIDGRQPSDDVADQMMKYLNDNILPR